MDCYSAFWNNGDCTQTSLFVDLLRRGVTDLYVCGLAFDVCVKETATDAVGQGFKTHVIVDACRGVAPEGIAKTKEEFVKNGIVLLESEKVREILIFSSVCVDTPSVHSHTHRCTLVGTFI